MLPFSIPAFGETNFFEEQMNRTARVVLIQNCPGPRFADYCALLEQNGFSEKERFAATHRSYAAFQKDTLGIFINYFAGTSELQLVVEEDSAYFSYTDSCGATVTTPHVTQLKLRDFGLCDTVRLSDGRFLIIDCGNAYEEDADALFSRLKQDSPLEKPVIAGWILTHPHCDHYHNFFPFMDKYGEEVVIEKFFFNFPEAEDLAHYPNLAVVREEICRWMGVENMPTKEALKLFCQRVEAMGVPVYMPHTGQCYQIGDAKLQFVATMDDTIHCSQNINATSLMFFMELGQQKIFFTADGSFSDARLAQRYGEELKSDILQVPHHGFGCGTDQGQIEGYRLIAPKTCLLSVQKNLAYNSFTTYREGTNYLMTRLGLEELLTGEKDQTLSLPYTPDPAEAFTLRQRYLEGRDSAGAKVWIFTDMNTGNREDFFFSVLNTTYFASALQVELYFENMPRNIVRIQNQSPRLGMFRLNCLLRPNEDLSQLDAPDFLKSLDIPENTNFAVRFLSDLPVVISHRDHKPAYRSSNV